MFPKKWNTNKLKTTWELGENVVINDQDNWELITQRQLKIHRKLIFNHIANAWDKNY